MKQKLLAVAITATLACGFMPATSAQTATGANGAQAAATTLRGAADARLRHSGSHTRGHAPDFFRDWIADFIANQIVRRMTLSEKLDYIGGTGAWNIKPLVRFSLPEIYGSDASLGVRLSSPPGVSYPAGQALASTWDAQLAGEFGASLGRDTRQLGFQDILGPGVNMYRTSYSGRAFEYMTGEDPYLGAVLAPQVINGIQGQGVWATLKHLALNDQEENRFKLDVQVDERTMRELYLVPFEAAVKVAKPANIMCAFNRINGDYACESRHIETEIVKQQWGYRGFIESDYNAIMDPQKAALAGTDIDMPSGYLMNETNLRPLVENGTVPESLIDDKVRRIIRQIVLFGFSEGNASTENTQTAEQRAQSQAVSLQIAEQGTVLLKNDNGALPFGTAPLRIAVIGQRSVTAPPAGFGSANISPYEYVNDIDGIRANAPAGSQIDYLDRLSLDPGLTPSVAGFTGAYSFNGVTQTRDDALLNVDWNNGGSPFGTDFPDAAVWTGQIQPTITGDHVLKLRADGAVRLQVNGQEVINNGEGTTITQSIPPTVPVSAVVPMVAGQTYTITIQYERKPNYFGALGAFQGVQFSWAQLVPDPAIAGYDAVVVVAGLGAEYEGEGFDRPFAMPEAQDELIANVAAANPHTSVVIHAGGGVNMRPWVDRAAAVLYAWYPGEMGGEALGRILFGKTNPSGKLPITIEKYETDNPAFATYPLPQNSLDSTSIAYSEGVLMGYRGYEARGITPEFAFGHGLSYSSFRYGNLRVTLGNTPYLDDRNIVARARFRVTNTSSVDGAEIAQIYVGEDNPSVLRPRKELKGFTRVELRAGQSRDVVVPLNARAFAYYDTSGTQWRVDRGAYTVSLGGASDAVADTDSVFMPRAQTLSVKDSLPAVVRGGGQ